jgi:Kef-type K+ transport system membrane component KefB
MLASGIEGPLLRVLVQTVVVVAAARVFFVLFRKVNQPGVVGEIAAGLVLGPSVLGKLEAWGWIPNISGFLFNKGDPSHAHVFAILSQLGLVLLLFLIGLEFDFRHLRSRARSAWLISASGILLPFALGAGLAYAMHSHLPAGERVPRLGFLLFMGTAMSITALPILGRMMMEMRISRTRVGAITITAAACDDAGGWILLAAVSALARSDFHILRTAAMVGLTLLFAGVMLYAVRPAMTWWIARTLRPGRTELGLNALAVVLVVLFLCAIATSLIGIFAIFGAFLLGAALSDQHEFRDAVQRTFGGLVTVLFLPLFFTYTGLRTDIGTISTPLLWGFAALVLLLAVLGKFGGCTVAAWIGGFTPRESVCIGTMMNTRALMELVVINVGYDLGVIPKSVFCMLVLMALVTTVMTTPILLRAGRRTELQEGLVRSGFLKEPSCVAGDETAHAPAG